MTIDIVLAEGTALEDAAGILDSKAAEAESLLTKGTQCLTDIVTHLSCNCGESDINSSYLLYCTNSIRYWGLHLFC
jgi:hypothetical protein